MPRSCLILIALLAQVLGVHAQAPKAKLWVSPCEDLCANLIAAIQRQPDTLEMRLEDALVINESCAAEIVASAMHAVRAEPHQVSRILETALNLAPRRSTAIREAIASYTPAAFMPVVQEEIRRAELPEGRPLLKKDQALMASQLVGDDGKQRIEIRRAELPDFAPQIEIRRAVLLPIPKATRMLEKPATRQRR